MTEPTNPVREDLRRRMGYWQVGELPPPERRWRVTFPYTGMTLANVTLRRALWECVRAVATGHGLPRVGHPGYEPVAGAIGFTYQDPEVRA